VGIEWWPSLFVTLFRSSFAEANMIHDGSIPVRS
jgi:hypothetical protein